MVKCVRWQKWDKNEWENKTQLKANDFSAKRKVSALPGGAGSVGAAAERRRGRHIALHRRVRSIRGSGGACGGDSSGRVILGSGQSVESDE